MNRKKPTIMQTDLDLAAALNPGASDGELEIHSDIHSMRSDYSNDFLKDKNAKENRFKPNDTLSEVYDPVEKEQLFEHSMSKGLFHNIKNSPLRERMPKNTQFFEEYKTKFQNFGSTTENHLTKPTEFIPFQPMTSTNLKFETDFTFNPKKFYCKLHPSQEIEYACDLVAGELGALYCKKCLPEHEGHKKDKVLN
jgi:hypothetical protein